MVEWRGEDRTNSGQQHFAGSRPVVRSQQVQAAFSSSSRLDSHVQVGARCPKVSQFRGRSSDGSRDLESGSPALGPAEELHCQRRSSLRTLHGGVAGRSRVVEKSWLKEKDKIIADLRHEIQQLKVSCKTSKHQINLIREI
ncbi:hypothetical protein CEXT_53631 [Caerostris extrusa]|uniref:Uncharacterized protein n=1 Tax=Caerostris extrusa TaxID=172846 RepID=A0AAV4VPK1_CAEEX|nr:hypothetical protein CEXT_53631 [Caerostris extrusa]